MKNKVRTVQPPDFQPARFPACPAGYTRGVNATSLVVVLLVVILLIILL
jgi:hypothetical protein